MLPTALEIILRAARTAKRGGSLCATTAQPVGFTGIFDPSNGDMVPLYRESDGFWYMYYVTAANSTEARKLISRLVLLQLYAQPVGGDGERPGGGEGGPGGGKKKRNRVTSSTQTMPKFIIIMSLWSITY